MKRKIGLLTAGAAVIILAYLYAHIDKNSYLYDRSMDSSEFVGTGILMEGDEIVQKFTCFENEMDAVNLKATITGNVEDILLEYSLLDHESGEKICASIQGNKLQNNKFNKLTFEKVRDTRGKEYSLILRESGADENNGISFYTGQKKDTEELLMVRGEERQGALVVRYVTHRFDLETFIVLLGFIAFVAMFMKVLYNLFK